jgi:hypothetical protein
VAARFYKMPLGGATIVPSGIFAGLTFGPTFQERSAFDGSEVFDQAPELVKLAREHRLMPQPGEPHDNVVDFIVHAQHRIIELLAGQAAELVLYPNEAPLSGSARDIWQAMEFAEMICAPEAVYAYL